MTVIDQILKIMEPSPQSLRKLIPNISAQEIRTVLAVVGWRRNMVSNMGLLDETDAYARAADSLVVSRDSIRLAAGEMTRGEMNAVMDVMAWCADTLMKHNSKH